MHARLDSPSVRLIALTAAAEVAAASLTDRAGEGVRRGARFGVCPPALADRFVFNEDLVDFAAIADSLLMTPTAHFQAGDDVLGPVPESTGGLDQND